MTHTEQETLATERQPHAHEEIYVFQGIEADDTIGIYFKEASRAPLLTHEEEISLAKRIEKGAKAQTILMRQAPDHQYSQKRQEQLASLVSDGTIAREQLICANLRLVITIAKRFRGRGLSFLEIIQEGNIGLMKATTKFEWERGNRFSTFATWEIEQVIRRAIENTGRTIRIPTNTIWEISKVKKTKRLLMQRLNRTPTPEEIASETDMTPDKVTFLLSASKLPCSLDEPTSDDEDTSLGDHLKANSDTAESAILHMVSTQAREALASLPQKEMTVLSLRYGFADGSCYTQQDVSKMLQVTPGYIHQLEYQALERLRRLGSKTLVLNDAL